MTPSDTPPQTTEVLIMPDGTIYVHNLTVGMTAALNAVNPTDERIRQRLSTAEGEPTSQPLSASPIP